MNTPTEAVPTPRTEAAIICKTIDHGDGTHSLDLPPLTPGLELTDAKETRKIERELIAAQATNAELVAKLSACEQVLREGAVELGETQAKLAEVRHEANLFAEKLLCLQKNCFDQQTQTLNCLRK